ncbi:hypothetical protein BDP27DRAFT_1232262, partial [Rhodocollybia butyracea]
PHHPVAPKQIPMEKLFGLDVDDAIWQDVGLDGDGDTLNPPLWLCDDQVRNGIRSVLLRDRCDEELCRLMNELLTQREWFSEEWQIVVDCIETVEDEDLVYQLKECRHFLLEICVTWKRFLDGIRNEELLPAWGPSQEDLKTARRHFNSDILSNLSEDDEDFSSGEEDFDEDNLDIGLIERMEALNVNVNQTVDSIFD